ncbi:MAG: hypothetical protein LBK29_02050 [Oscillospiraceae bacterium]|jgi:hypothetical protein|nr:hypothetical protein [Oscillospiraceae bacterium]
MFRKKRFAVSFICIFVFLQFFQSSYIRSYYRGDKFEEHLATNKKTNKTKIIFIPGITGSGLFDRRNNEAIYGKAGTVAYYKTVYNIGKLYFTEDGKPVDANIGAPRSDVKFSDSESEEIAQYGTECCYKQIVLSLKKIPNYEKDIIFFNYDWRRDINETSKKLYKRIKKEKCDKFTLVCFSLGGLVTFLTLNKLKKNNLFEKIKKVVFVGVPFGGSATASMALNQGTNDEKDTGWGISAIRRRIFANLSSSFFSTYQLLPTRSFGYFTKKDEEEPEGFIYGFNDKLLNLEQEIEFLKKQKFAKKFTGDCKETHFEKMKKINSKITLKNLEVLNEIDCYFIAGKGFPTVLTVEKKNDRFVQKESADGDGVVTFSQSAIPPNFLESNKVFSFILDHSSLVTNPDSIKTIVELVSD